MDISTIEAIVHNLIINIESLISELGGSMDDGYAQLVERQLATAKDTLKMIITHPDTNSVPMQEDILVSLKAIYPNSEWKNEDSYTTLLDDKIEEAIMWDGCEPM